MNLSDLLIIGLAVFYWSYALTRADGPFQIFLRLREFRGGKWHGRYGLSDEKTLWHNGLFDCSVCLSIWLAAVFFLAPVGWLTVASAAAGGAMFLMGWSGWRYD